MIACSLTLVYPDGSREEVSTDVDANATSWTDVCAIAATLVPEAKLIAYTLDWPPCQLRLPINFGVVDVRGGTS